MSELAQRFMDVANSGGRYDLSCCPGEELESAARYIEGTPYVGDFFAELCAAATEDAYRVAAAMVIEANDPGGMTEIVRFIATTPAFPERITRLLHKTFLEVSGNRSTHYGTRSQALLGGLCLAKDQTALQRLLQAHLLDLDPDDDGAYLQHAARIIGILLAHVDDPELAHVLQRLQEVPEAEDEASFALGLIEISKALDTSDRASAMSAFRSARAYMVRSQRATEVRPDAALYCECVNLLLAFHNEAEGQDLRAMLENIRHHASDYSVRAFSSDRPIDRHSWLGLQALEGLRWHELALRVASLDMSLKKKAWLDAARVIEEELLHVYEASRSLLKRSAEGSIETILRPRIIGTLQKKRAQLLALEQWLEENAEAINASKALAIKNQVHAAMEVSLRRNPLEAADSLPESAAEIIEAGSLSAKCRESALVAVDAARISFERRKADAVVYDVFERLQADLISNPDYAQGGEARALFNELLISTLDFAASRLNATSTFVPAVDYIFNRSRENPPVEADLHQDYYSFLQATSLRGTAQPEVPGVGHGRADVFFHYCGVRTVAELKRTFADHTLQGLASEYGLQTAAYQQTSITLCVLIVLDLVDRQGNAHLRDQVAVVEVQPAAGNTRYSVVVFRIQGRKKSPSRHGRM